MGSIHNIVQDRGMMGGKGEMNPGRVCGLVDILCRDFSYLVKLMWIGVAKFMNYY